MIKENNILIYEDLKLFVLRNEFNIDKNKFINLINSLIENEENCYFIDRFPKTILNIEKYDEIEDYYIKTYSQNYSKDIFADELFAKKVTKIILTFISYYEFIIYYEKINNLDFKKFENSLNNKGFYKIANLIEYIVTKDLSNIHFLLKNRDSYFLISVRGGYNVEIYSPNNEDLELISLLVKNEGLFLRKFT